MRPVPDRSGASPGPQTPPDSLCRFVARGLARAFAEWQDISQNQSLGRAARTLDGQNGSVQPSLSDSERSVPSSVGQLQRALPAPSGSSQPGRGDNVAFRSHSADTHGQSSRPDTARPARLSSGVHQRSGSARVNMPPPPVLRPSASMSVGGQAPNRGVEGGGGRAASGSGVS